MSLMQRTHKVLGATWNSSYNQKNEREEIIAINIDAVVLTLLASHDA